jgi:hypothetical protein
MSKQRVKITLLCEDKQQEVFARYFLEKYGFKRQDIYSYPIPIGQSGEQFVRETYPNEVRKYRQAINIKISNQRKNARCTTIIVLILMTDADNLSVQQRLNQLSSVLRSHDLPDRKTQEAIAVFIPRRNIETWIRYLKGEKVNEEDKKTYNKLLKESDCKPYSDNLAERCQLQQKLEDAPDSLNIACQEFQRLLTLLNSI